MYEDTNYFLCPISFSLYPFTRTGGTISIYFSTNSFLSVTFLRSAPFDGTISSCNNSSPILSLSSFGQSQYKPSLWLDNNPYPYPSVSRTNYVLRVLPLATNKYGAIKSRPVPIDTCFVGLSLSSYA
jgi:hypothetical protein|uniref:Uncharacterized protein n=1 Tax=Picea glauca TaxID=3330 RepID=A0A101LVM6_PICGL|nr:hypothetical protein ABT39_MTgene2091 [Picea glauca]QHR86944.1 hypothetical protein Q903MT_gene951 [Picea sitchensis]